MTSTFGGYKRIMLPIDFSVHCERAAMHAAWLAGMSGGTVHMVHVVVNPVDPQYEPAEVPHWIIVEHSEKKSIELLDAVAQQCLPPQCVREKHVYSGDAYTKLMEVATQVEPDIIVMSTRGSSGIAHLVIGSVAEKVARHAACPVLLVRREEPTG